MRVGAAGVALLVAATVAPAAEPSKAAAPFDGAAALRHVERLVALGPRPAGSLAAAKARAYILGELRAAGVAARVEPFIDDVASAYRWADLVVARAGGITLAELAIVGVGAILVPFRAAIDDHQTRNAEHFTRAGAGLKFAEQELSPGALARALLDCLGDFERLVGYAEAARAQAHVDAAERLAAACVTAAEASA